MCGIAGEFVLGREGRVDAANVVPMISILAHRGPDEWGYYVDDLGRAMLLHTRLAIIDLQRGRQPMANEDRTIWVACNGEIYDFERLTRQLESRGHRFRSRSDCEVIVHLYEEHGEDFVKDLRGEFALALYDARQRTAYLVRDRFGIKPLFYAVVGDSLVFGSEMKALFRHHRFRAELDADSLARYLAGCLPPGETLFKDVRQVEPGCMLRIRESDVRQTPYWDLEPWDGRDARSGPPRSTTSDRDYAEEFLRLFQESVRLRLRSDVGVGVYLSGGLDSSSVACLMSRLTGRPIQAFSVGFDEPAYDESPLARAVAARCHAEHHVLVADREALADHFVRSLWHSEMPMFNGHATAKLLLSEMARRHVKVVLTGEGADELLAGYGLFKHQVHLDAVARDPGDAAARRALATFLASERVWINSTRSRRYVRHAEVLAQLGVYPYSVLKGLVNSRKIVPLLSAGFRERMGRIDCLDVLAGWVPRERLRGLSSMAATQYLLFKLDLPGYTLSCLGDRVEMAGSVESRLPFLDHKLVEFAWQLPDHLKLRHDQEKYLLRLAMAELLPELAGRRKTMFMAPPADLLRLGRWRALLQSYLAPAKVRELGVFDPRRLYAVWQGTRCLPRGSYLHAACEMGILLALSLSILFELFCQDFPGSADRFSAGGRKYEMGAGLVGGPSTSK